MSNYPPGAQYDSSAPYNKKEEEPKKHTLYFDVCYEVECADDQLTDYIQQAKERLLEVIGVMDVNEL
jgi:hypothetical protein